MLLLVDFKEDEAAIRRGEYDIDVGILFLAGHEVAREGTVGVKVDLAAKLARGWHSAARKGLDVIA